MKKIGKVALLVLTCWIPIYFIFFMVNFIRIWHGLQMGDSHIADFMFETIFPLHFSTIILTVILLIIYILHIVRRKDFNDSKKTLWVVLVLFANALGMLMYFFKYVWPDSVHLQA
jgi:hypothetical protein